MAKQETILRKDIDKRKNDLIEHSELVLDNLQEFRERRSTLDITAMHHIKKQLDYVSGFLSEAIALENLFDDEVE